MDGAPGGSRLNQACGRCGTRRSGQDPLAALAWVHQPGERGALWLCPACARNHVRDIEGKLPGEWWC